MIIKGMIFLAMILFMAACQFGGPDPNINKGECSDDFPQGVCVPGKVCKAGKCYKIEQNCSKMYPDGKCYDGKVCYQGVCVKDASECSVDHPNGICEDGYVCVLGGCELETFPCSNENTNGYCDSGKTCVNGSCVSESDKCSIDNLTGKCDSGYECIDGECKAKQIDLGSFNTFTGKWAQRLFLPSDNKTLGITTGTKTYNYYILTMTQNEDNTITSHGKLCDIQVEVENPMGGTEMSDAYIDNTHPSEIMYKFSLDGEKIKVSHPESIEVNGANLVDINDDLPISSDDERVIDQDNDGKPGMTLNITTMGQIIEVYVVSRSKKTLTGSIDSDNSFSGVVIWDEEQSVIGSDNPAMNTPIEINPLEGNFKTLRVDENFNCDKLIEEENTLFE